MKRILLAVLFFAGLLHAQDKVEYFPDNLNIQPYTANFLEPKLGFLFHTSDDNLRLDIGNSLDVFHYNINEKETFSMGADLFTYTRLRSEKDFHFPVETVDYLFGLNFGYKKVQCNNVEYGARLRISHISAHLVDGYYDLEIDTWRNGQYPHVYSREFIEFIPYYKWNDLRVYAGYTYLFHIDPTDVGRNIMQAGFDYFAEDVISEIFTPFFAYDLRIEKIGDQKVTHILEAGMKVGHAWGRGFSVFFQYHNGVSIHGEFYGQERKYSSLGLNLDL